jgi:hypothetical protein
MKIGLGISPMFRGGGVDWGAYWATREPSALVLTVVSDVRIDATWTDSAETGADGYKVYISTDNATWTLNDTVAVGVQASSITGLTQATIYYVKVVAYKGTNESTGVSNFQLTLATAFVGGVANTKRYIAYDLDTITKDVNDYVSAVAEKYGSGETLAPEGTNYPLWTSDGIKVIAYGGLVAVLKKAFTLNQPCEVYVSMMLPTWTSNMRVISSPGAEYIFRQVTSSPKLYTSFGFASTNIDFPLNEFHVAYTVASDQSTQDIFGVDGTEVTGQNLGPNNPGGISLGGNTGGYGLKDMIWREVVIRNVVSSAADRAGIVRYLRNVNAFFF